MSEREEYWRSIAEWQRDEIIKKCDSFKEEDDEIDRLRAELAEAEDAYDSLSETDTELIGEQRKRIEELKAWGEDWRTQALKNRDRIEELEKQQDIHCGVIQDLVCEDSHVRITTAQIDAMWGKAIAETRSKRETTYTFQALRALNIERCEECGGSGEKDEYPDPNDDLPAPGPCPSCNGHRWRLT